MKGAPSISYAELSVFSYSTEDETKVRRAVLNVLPKELGEGVRFSSRSLRGYYKDRITLLKVELKRGAWAFAHHLISHLSPLGRRRLLDELDMRMDKSGNLYIRLDKQDALLGRIELGESDPIRIKMKFKINGKRVHAQGVRRTLMGLLGEGEQIIKGSDGSRS